MKFLLALMTLLFLVEQTFANDELEITIKNIDTQRGGNLIVLTFKDDNFPINHENAIATKTLKVQSSTQKVKFKLTLIHQELAFKVLHDEDSNNKTSKNWTGIWPSEGLGFSNNQKMGSFGPPSFDDSKLKREQYLNGVTLTVKYP